MVFSKTMYCSLNSDRSAFKSQNVFLSEKYTVTLKSAQGDVSELFWARSSHNPYEKVLVKLRVFHVWMLIITNTILFLINQTQDLNGFNWKSYKSFGLKSTSVTTFFLISPLQTYHILLCFYHIIYPYCLAEQRRREGKMKDYTVFLFFRAI